MAERDSPPLIDLPLPPRGESFRSRATRFFRHHRARIAAAVAIAVGALVMAGHFLGGVAGLWEMYKLATGKHAPAPHAQAPAPLLSVAVLQFKVDGPSAETLRVAERVTRDVTTGIERAMRGALIVSPGLTAQHAGKMEDPRVLGRELNVRYLLHGDVSQEGDSVAVSVRLLDAAQGRQLWSDRVVAQGSGDSGVAAQVANRLRAALYDAERKRLADLPKASASAMEIVLRADAQWEQDPTPKGLQAARKSYEEALRLDPASPSALMALFRTSFGQFFHALGADRDRLVKEMDDISLRAVRADRNDPRAWIARGNALGFQWKWDAALEANGEALRIDPYRNTALAYRGSLLILTGRAEEALPFLERAVAMDPRGSARSLDTKCSAHLQLGQYDDAIAACEKSLSLEENLFSRARLVALYAQKGEAARAEALKVELLKRKPNFTIEGLRALRISDNAVFLTQREEHLFAGLRKAGIPDQ